MLAAIVCERFKLSYEQYRDQPDWYNAIVWSMLKQESLARAREAKKAGA